MESLIRQTRVKFSGTRQDNKEADGSSAKDRKIPPQKTQSFADGTKTSSEDPDDKLSTSTSSSKRPPEKAPSIKKRISFADTDETKSNKPEKPALQKAPEPAPSMKKPPTFTDKQLNIIEGKRTDTTVPKPDRPAPGLSTTQPVETRRQSATKPGPGDSKADDWEKEELESIRERYEKLRATIENWETKKKKKAKRKLERIEAELDKRRAKVVQSYHSDIKRIEGIAGGARAQAEKNRKNEELKGAFWESRDPTYINPRSQPDPSFSNLHHFQRRLWKTENKSTDMEGSSRRDRQYEDETPMREEDQIMHLTQADIQHSIKTKLFVTTLKGKAQEWFTNLASGLIDSFEQLV
ncbi:UNVERIFIED_CONTAM: hypothetical protein Sindi_1980600 [Sesamum indicum]